MDALYEENGRVCGVICGDDILRARYVVLAEGASVLAERHGLVTRPAGEAMALGIKEALLLGHLLSKNVFIWRKTKAQRCCSAAGFASDLPAAGSGQLSQTLSGIVCPLSSLTQSCVPASELLNSL